MHTTHWRRIGRILGPLTLALSLAGVPHAASAATSAPVHTGTWSGLVTGATAIVSPGATVVVPARWTDPVTHLAYTLDTTGRTDVSDGLNLWFARGVVDGAIPAGRAGHPTIVRFPANAQYRVEYGLALGSIANTKAHPGVPAYTLRHVVVDMNGGRLFQTDNTVFKAAVPRLHTAAVQPRRRWGTTLLMLHQAQDVVVENGTVQGGHATATDATYSPHASWIGVHLGGVHDVTLHDLAIRNVWSDFIYLSQSHTATRPAQPIDDQNVLVDGVTMDVSGRQGIVANDADGVLVRHSTMNHMPRFTIDIEPTGGDVVHALTFLANTWHGGNLGFFNASVGPSIDFSNLTFANNVQAGGQLRIQLPAARPGTTPTGRDGLVITGNTSLDPAHPIAGGALIAVTGWRHVVVTGNTQYGTRKARAVALASCPGAVTAPNHFVGFGA